MRGPVEVGVGVNGGFASLTQVAPYVYSLHSYLSIVVLVQESLHYLLTSYHMLFLI